MRNFLFVILLLTLFFAGCSTVKVTDYEQRLPELRPETFFNGKLGAHGVVKNRSGKVIRYFNADINAYWEDGIGTLEEDFIFNNGEKQRRVWTLIRQEGGHYSGTAGDVIGEARGEVAGNSMFLTYVLRVPYDNDTLDLVVDDRMYLVNPDTIVNESEMRKFGLRVGQIILVIRKE